MIPNMPTIGVRFDIDKIGGGYYGFTCWKAVWRALTPEDLGVAHLYEGDTAETVADRENVFCIAIQSLDTQSIARIKASLSRSDEILRICANPMLDEGLSCWSEPLVDAGRIDAEGNLVGKAGASRSALGAIRKEHEAAVPEAPAASIPKRAQPASERTSTLPALSSFEDLSKFINSRFSTKAYQGTYGPVSGCWITAEELCDVVERYGDLVLVSLDEYSCGASEDMCRVRLFERNLPGTRPIGFNGQFPFPSLSDARSFGRDWDSVPEYARDLPRLADVRSKYHFNFTRGGSAENSESKPFDANRAIPTQELWAKLYRRKQKFLSEIEREETLAQQRAEEDRIRNEQNKRQRTEEERRRQAAVAERKAEDERRACVQATRRTSGQCTLCGGKLGFFERLLGRESHGACSSFIG